MAKPLSEHLADLSVHAKHAEDALAAAKKEAHDKVVARKEQARAAAAAAAEKVNNDIKSAEDTATRNWNAVRAKIAADINTFKADITHKKHDLLIFDKHSNIRMGDRPVSRRRRREVCGAGFA